MSIVYVAKAGSEEVEAVTFIQIWKIITGIKKDKKGEDVACVVIFCIYLLQTWVALLHPDL